MLAVISIVSAQCCSVGQVITYSTVYDLHGVYRDAAVRTTVYLQYSTVLYCSAEVSCRSPMDRGTVYRAESGVPETSAALCRVRKCEQRVTVSAYVHECSA